MKEDLRSGLLGPRVAGGTMIVASLAMIFAMLHHPTVSAHDIPGIKQELQRESPVNRLVHGAAIGLTLLLIPCFSWLSSCLGFHLTSVRMAMTAFAAGAGALTIAALVSGFIVPDYFAALHIDTRPDVVASQTRLLRVINSNANNLGVLCISVAGLCWLTAFLFKRSSWRINGFFGIAIFGGMAAGFFAGWLPATVNGVIAFAATFGIWTIVVGYQMICGKIRME